MCARVLLACVLLLSAPAAQAQFWCWDADEIEAEVDGDTVRLYHLSALLNCCPDPITYEILVGDATVLVVEHSESPCNCDCCYNLEVTLGEFPAGPWNILYRWFDIEIGDWAERSLQIEIPDLGQGYVPFVAGQTISGCLETAGLLEPVQRILTWGAIKTHYR